MKTLKPGAIKKGDLIGIISPASSPDDLSKIQKGCDYLEKLGYKTIVGKNVGKYSGYLAGNDNERIEDLHDMFSNKDIQAIFCVRGGYGTIRLLDKINYSIIRKNPKILVGYSDITALQAAIYKKTGLVTFSGPMVAVEMANGINQYTEEYFWEILTNKKTGIKIKNPDNMSFEYVTKGSADGILQGGNLSMIICLMGTKYLSKFKDSILYIEDVDEKPYKIDKYLAQLKLGGVLNKIKGIILGEFTDCEETDSEKKSLSLNQVFLDYLSELKIPILKNLKYGHIPVKVTIPYGISCEINSRNQYIKLLEPSVT